MMMRKEMKGNKKAVPHGNKQKGQKGKMVSGKGHMKKPSKISTPKAA